MPSSQTITSFNSFSAGQLIRSAYVNTNFSVFRGHLLPVAVSTEAAASTLTYDLGSADHSWMNSYVGVNVMQAQSTPAANPTSTQYKMYFKSNGNLYKLNSAGTETQIDSGSIPLTVKGDIMVHDGSASVRLPVGTNGFIIYADSSATSGIKWAAVGSLAVSTKTAAYTATSSDDVILADGSTAGFTVELPTAVGITGKELIIKKIDSTASLITIDGNGSQTIDGTVTIAMPSQNDSIRLISDNANWRTAGKDIKTLYQLKILGADLAASTTTVATLAYAGLKTGKLYRLQMNVLINVNSAADSTLTAVHNATNILRVYGDGDAAAGGYIYMGSGSTIFSAAVSTLTFNFSRGGSSILKGDGSYDGTFVFLEELPDHILTSQW